MNEQQTLLNLLSGCLDQYRIKQSQEQLQVLKQSPTFCQSLLTLLARNIQDQRILIMAISTLKKYIEDRLTNPHNPMPQAAKQLILSNIVDMFYSLKHCDAAVNQYKVILYMVISASFPWANLNISDPSKIQANIYFYRQLAKAFQFLIDKKYRDLRDEFTLSYFPAIEQTVQQIMSNYNDETAKLLLELLQMFSSLIHLDLPQYLRDFNNIGRWISFLQTILEAPLEAKDSTNFWKIRDESSKILLKLFQQYCNGNSDGKQWKGWGPTFTQKFTPQMLNTTEKLFYLTKVSYVHEDVTANLLKIFLYSLKNVTTMEMLLPRCNTLLFDYLLPAIDLKEPDIALLHRQPLEFIRKQEDLSANIVRRCSIDLIEAMANLNLNDKSFLIRFLEYAATALEDVNLPYQRKDTIIYIIGKLHVKILKNSFIKEKFNVFMLQYLLPFLKTNVPLMLSTTCETISLFLAALQPDKAAIQSIIEALYSCLMNNCLVVRYKAILGFSALLSHEEAVALTKPHFSNILGIYVKIMDELDHQNLLKALEKMVGKFQLEISQVGDRLVRHLIQMFQKFAMAKPQDDLDDIDEEDTSRAATASLATIRQIFKTGLIQHMYLELSPLIINLLVFIMENELSYLNEIVEVFAALVQHSQRISDYVFPYLFFRKALEGVIHPNNLPCSRPDIIVKMIKSDFEQEDEILSILKNIIRQMPIELLNSYPLPSNPALILCLIENKRLEPSQLGTLSTAEVDQAWVGTLQSYVALLYGVGNIANNQNAIRLVPNGVSLFPWIRGIDEPAMFSQVMRKVLGRLDQQSEQSDDGGDTLQQLRKYSSDDDVDDGDYVEPQPLYSHMYTSPFDVNKDISLIIEKLRSKDGGFYQAVQSKLTKNEISKFQRMVPS